MIVDTSALIAVLNSEPEASAFLKAIQEHPPVRISAATYIEAAIIVDRSPDAVVRARLDEILNLLEAVIEPVTASQARLARQAFRDFGKGSGGGAGLNYGDCFAYALAKDKGEPLLYKGADFAKTDIPFVGSRNERRRISELLVTYGRA